MGPTDVDNDAKRKRKQTNGTMWKVDSYLHKSSDSTSPKRRIRTSVRIDPRGTDHMLQSPATSPTKLPPEDVHLCHHLHRA